VCVQNCHKIVLHFQYECSSDRQTDRQVNRKKTSPRGQSQTDLWFSYPARLPWRQDVVLSVMRGISGHHHVNVTWCRYRANLRTRKMSAKLRTRDVLIKFLRLEWSVMYRIEYSNIRASSIRRSLVGLSWGRRSDRVKPSFVLFDIRALWCSALSVRVPGCQKLQNDGLTRSGTGCFVFVRVWHQWASNG